MNPTVKLIATVGFLVSCSGNNGLRNLVVFDQVPEPVSITASRISLPGARLPVHLSLIDGLLFIVDLKSTEGMVTVFDIETKRVVKSVIPVGEGPFELSSVSAVFEGPERTVCFYDVQSYRLLSANLDSLVRFAAHVPTFRKRIYRFDHDHTSYPVRIVNYKQGENLAYVVPGVDGRFVSIDEEWNMDSTYFGPYPPLERPGDMSTISYYARVLSNLYSCQFALSKDQNQMVVTHYNVDLIEIYDLATKSLVQRIVGPDGNFPPDYRLNKLGQAMPCRDCKCGYSSPVPTSRYLAVLRLDKLYSSMDSYLSRFIYLFEWDGKITRVLQLDSEISDFVIDETNGKIYATSFDADAPLLEYDIDLLD
jgi:hypothetical protein